MTTNMKLSRLALAALALVAGGCSFDISNPNAGARLLEVIQIPKTEPDQHGLALHNGYLYYCDSGLTDPGPGSMPGEVCRFKLNTAAATTAGSSAARRTGSTGPTPGSPVS